MRSKSVRFRFKVEEWYRLYHANLVVDAIVILALAVAALVEFYTLWERRPAATWFQPYAKVTAGRRSHKGCDECFGSGDTVLLQRQK